MSATACSNPTICTDPAASRLVAEYIAVHDDPTPAAFAALFAPDLVVVAPGAPPEGRDADDYLRFLQSIKGTRFRQVPGSELHVDGEGRLVLQWTVTDRAGELLAAGTDHLRVRDGRIVHILGIH